MADQRAVLRKHFLFHRLDALPEELTALPVRHFARGEVICGPDSSRRALGIVLAGRAEAVAASREAAVLAAFGAGDTFGAAALFGGGGYVSSIRAVTGCSVVLIPETLLEQWLGRYPEMATDYIRFLSGRVRFLNGKIAILSQDSARQRLYRWLRLNCDAAGGLPEGITMTKLAATLSMGRTSLYRAMEELEAAGVLRRHGKRIEVIL